MPNYQSLYAGQQIDAAIEEYLHNGNMAIVQYSASESDWVEAHDSAKGKYCLSIKLTGRYSTGSFPKTLVREVLADGTVVPLDCTIDTHEDEHEYNTIYIDIYANVQKNVDISILSSKQPTYNAPVMLSQPRYESVGDGVHVATSKYNAQYDGQQIDSFVGEFVRSGTRGLCSYDINEDQWENSAESDLDNGKYLCRIVPEGQYAFERFPTVNVYSKNEEDWCELNCCTKIEYSGEESGQIVIKIYSNIKINATVRVSNIRSSSDVDFVFGNNSWQKIREVFRSGEARNYWSVGDEKTIKIDGFDYSVRIVDMQIGRYDFADGSGNKSNGVFEVTRLFSMGGSPTDVYMNGSASNAGGWRDSHMRRTYMPNILDFMEEDLRNSISEVNVLSGTGSASASGTTSSSCKLFLPAETEISDVSNSIGQSESPVGKFDYYTSHSSPSDLLKKYNDSTETIGEYWLRSPMSGSSYRFCKVMNIVLPEYGALGTDNANVTHGVSLFFAI